MEFLKHKTCLIILLLFLGIAPLLALPKFVYPISSLILPGTGELLLGYNSRGATLIGVDLVTIYTFIATNREIELQKKNYMQFAELYAGVPYGMPNEHYQAVQDYPNSDYYNDIQEMMARNYYLIYNYDPDSYEEYISLNTYQDNEEWSWQSDEKWQEYKNIRKRHQKTKMNNQLALGLMLLNRSISIIDSSILSKKQHGELYFIPLPANGAMLNYQINF